MGSPSLSCSVLSRDDGDGEAAVTARLPTSLDLNTCFHLVEHDFIQLWRSSKQIYVIVSD